MVSLSSLHLLLSPLMVSSNPKAWNTKCRLSQLCPAIGYRKLYSPVRNNLGTRLQNVTWGYVQTFSSPVQWQHLIGPNFFSLLNFNQFHSFTLLLLMRFPAPLSRMNGCIGRAGVWTAHGTESVFHSPNISEIWILRCFPNVHLSLCTPSPVFHNFNQLLKMILKQSPRQYLLYEPNTLLVDCYISKTFFKILLPECG